MNTKELIKNICLHLFNAIMIFILAFGALVAIIETL